MWPDTMDVRPCWRTERGMVYQIARNQRWWAPYRYAGEGLRGACWDFVVPFVVPDHAVPQPTIATDLYPRCGEQWAAILILDPAMREQAAIATPWGWSAVGRPVENER